MDVSIDKSTVEAEALEKIKIISKDVEYDAEEVELMLFGTSLISNIDRSVSIYEYLSSKKTWFYDQFGDKVLNLMNRYCKQGIVNINSIDYAMLSFKRARYCDPILIKQIESIWNKLCIEAMDDIKTLQDANLAYKKAPAHCKSKILILNIWIKYIEDEIKLLKSIEDACVLYGSVMDINNNYIQKEYIDSIDNFILKEVERFNTIFEAKAAYELFPKNTSGSKLIMKKWDELAEGLIPNIDCRTDFNLILDNVNPDGSAYSVIFDLKWELLNPDKMQSAEDFKMAYYDAQPKDKKTVLKLWDDYCFDEADSIIDYCEALELYKNLPPKSRSKNKLLKLMYDLI